MERRRSDPGRRRRPNRVEYVREEFLDCLVRSALESGDLLVECRTVVRFELVAFRLERFAFVFQRFELVLEEADGRGGVDPVDTLLCLLVLGGLLRFVGRPFDPELRGLEPSNLTREGFVRRGLLLVEFRRRGRVLDGGLELRLEFGGGFPVGRVALVGRRVQSLVGALDLSAVVESRFEGVGSGLEFRLPLAEFLAAFLELVDAVFGVCRSGDDVFDADESVVGERLVYRLVFLGRRLERQSSSSDSRVRTSPPSSRTTSWVTSRSSVS